MKLWRLVIAQGQNNFSKMYRPFLYRFQYRKTLWGNLKKVWRKKKFLLKSMTKLEDLTVCSTVFSFNNEKIWLCPQWWQFASFFLLQGMYLTLQRLYWKFSTSYNYYPKYSKFPYSNLKIWGLKYAQYLTMGILLYSSTSRKMCFFSMHSTYICQNSRICRKYRGTVQSVIFM